jgi:DNA-binding GntR family transcriptional regulator
MFATWQSLEWHARSDDEHRAILQAIKDKRTDRACRLLSDHILDAGRALAAALKTR